MSFTIEEIEKNIIRFGFTGYVDDETAHAFSVAMQPFIDQASVEDPLYLLSADSASPQASRTARQQFVEIMKDPRIARIAITQSNPFIKVLTTFIVKAAGRGDAINFFSTEEECLVWLKEQRS